MPQGGRLVIRTENAPIDERYGARNPEVEPGQYVSITVTDTGEGATPEVARAFDPFFKTKPVTAALPARSSK
jgi:signal transduction histidine kinase